jgi:hypothetical protein
MQVVNNGSYYLAENSYLVAPLANAFVCLEDTTQERSRATIGDQDMYHVDTKPFKMVTEVTGPERVTNGNTPDVVVGKVVSR